MKKLVLTFGLIAGTMISAFLVLSIGYCYQSGSFEGNMLLGYAAMLLSFSMVFVGIKNYRDKYNNGLISFGEGFKIGLFISLIASTMYVLTWLVDYYLFIPDFMDKYGDQMIKAAQSNGATQAELASTTAEMTKYKEMYSTPIGVILLTYMEILPVGLVVSLISALILKKK